MGTVEGAASRGKRKGVEKPEPVCPLEPVDEAGFLEDAGGSGDKAAFTGQGAPKAALKERATAKAAHKERGAAKGASEFMAQWAPLFCASAFPVLIIDRNLLIVNANAPCTRIFGEGLAGKRFFDKFGASFSIEDFRAIREGVLKGEAGWSWKCASAQIKQPGESTILTRVYVSPGSVSAPSEEYLVMFDDVTEENRALLRSQLESLLTAAKLKDNDTGRHTERVNYYATAIAKALAGRPDYEAVDADFIQDIGFLASLHDVGKIGTPDDILNKKGPLTRQEWLIMKQHTVNGAFILSSHPNPMAREIALGHHERWNGKGYPYGIEGEKIPLAARIVSIADVYDALRMKRSYKPALSHEEALGKITENAFSQFDPKLVDIVTIIGGEFDDLYTEHADGQ